VRIEFSLFSCCVILEYCHVFGVCTTNKTGFWIWRSNLLDLYTTGYNSSRITICHTVICFWLDTVGTILTSNWTELHYSVVLLRTPVFNDPLPRNGCPFVFESVTSGMCLRSCCLSVDICVTIHFRCNYALAKDVRWSAHLGKHFSFLAEHLVY
jgi:hypothetical protein